VQFAVCAFFSGWPGSLANPGGRSPQEETTQRSPRRSIWPNVPAAAALVDFVDPDCKQSGPPRLRNSPSAILLVDSQRCSDELSYRSRTANCTQSLNRFEVALDARIERLLLSAAGRRTRAGTTRKSSLFSTDRLDSPAFADDATDGGAGCA
jgi:hypothetical protein